jgi:hypothetical protein
VNGATPSLPGTTFVTHEPTRWVLDIQGPLGVVLPQLAHLPVADVSLAAFSIDEAILHLMGDPQ